MKKIILLLLITVPIIISAQEKVIWDYPVKPGSEEWNSLKNRTERLNAMQIPPDILSKMETEELVIICINYPAALHYGTYTNEYEGVGEIIKGFNGLQELLNRKDACKYLTKIYQNSVTEGLLIKDVRINKRFWPLKFRYIELLLSQDQVIDIADDKDIEILLSVSVAKTKLKYEKSFFFSKYDNIISSYIIAKALYKLKTTELISNLDYTRFATNRELKTYDHVIKIIDIGKQYVVIINNSNK